MQGLDGGVCSSLVVVHHDEGDAFKGLPQSIGNFGQGISAGNAYHHCCSVQPQESRNAAAEMQGVRRACVASPRRFAGKGTSASCLVASHSKDSG
jgi:hypothetical protein